LKIGDEWMAIQIIARSQTNPQKAIAELVENSIDAGATRITITRGRRRGRVFLRVSDNGHGVPLNAEGVPDFDYVATHVCDSLKRRLDQRQRGGVQGEFGIGLLGFWSIGRELEMVSQAGDAPPHIMIMRSGSRTYDRRRYLGARAGTGVDVTIHEVHREVQSRLTAEKLQRYLGEELRERIRRRALTIVLEDRLPPSKTLEVRPAVFLGERIAEIGEIPVADHPPVRAEIYVAAETPPGAERPAVSLYRLGTRVCQDIATLPEFALEPWFSGRLEGALDYADFYLAPASREGFTPDAAYHAFVEAVRGIEPILLERLSREEEARAERAGRSLVRELQSAFARTLRDLPAGEYEWFGADGRRPFAGGGHGRPGGPDAVPGGAEDLLTGPDAVPADLDAAPSGREGDAGDAGDAGTLDGEELELEAPAQPALITGPLDRVAIKPAVVRVAVGRRRQVAAIALDASGLPIERNVEHSWTLSPGAGSLTVQAGGRAIVEGGDRPAHATLAVRVRTDAAGGPPREVSAEADVLVEAEAARRAFPPPVFVHAPGEAWRSRWNGAIVKLEVNSGHPDYQVVRQNPARRRRYLGRLYAKELVLHNFGHEPSAAVLDRLLEVLARLDEHL
jgi:histidine kinase/DNA gyrase B/HSP90-like ATPase